MTEYFIKIFYTTKFGTKFEVLESVYLPRKKFSHDHTSPKVKLLAILVIGKLELGNGFLADNSKLDSNKNSEAAVVRTAERSKSSSFGMRLLVRINLILIFPKLR